MRSGLIVWLLCLAARIDYQPSLLNSGAEIEMDWLGFLKLVLSVGTVVCTCLAGINWAGSASVKIPNLTAGTNWDGSGPYPDALKEQGRLNARAAAWACFAAAFQAAVFIWETAAGLLSPH